MTDASKHPVRNSLLLGAAAISATFALAGATGTLARKILPEDPPEPPETIEPDGGVVAQDPIAIEPARDASAEGALADAGVAAARVSPPRTTVRRTTPRTTRVRTRSS